MTTSTNVQRCASPSPLASARHASAERRRSSEEDVTKGYKTLFETVNPMIEGLNTRVGTVEARLTAQESSSRQEVDGLKARIVQLEIEKGQLHGDVNELRRELSIVRQLAQSTSDRFKDHTHKVPQKAVQTGRDRRGNIVTSVHPYNIESAKPT